MRCPHDPLCPRSEHVQQYIDAVSCVFCQVISQVVRRERARQFPDPFENQTTVEGER